MSLHLWGRLSSINVRKVVLCAQWLDLELPRTDAGMAFGVVDTPAYRALNPNGLVPVLQDGDFTLWESNAIVRYLCAREGRGYPADLRLRADAERWMDWQQTTLNRASGPAFVQWVRTPAAQRSAIMLRSPHRSRPPSRCSPGSTSTSRSAPSCSATNPAWPTFRSPASCTAGSACRKRAPRGLTSSVTSTIGSPSPAPAACLTFPCPECFP